MVSSEIIDKSALLVRVNVSGIVDNCVVLLSHQVGVVAGRTHWPAGPEQVALVESVQRMLHHESC